jgi:hypothetical protein
LSKVDAADEETLAKQIDRLRRTIRTCRAEAAQGVKRSKPLLLSTVTRRGLTEVLRRTAAAIEAGRRDAAIANVEKASAPTAV